MEGLLLESLIITYFAHNLCIYFDSRRNVFNPSEIVDLRVPVSIIVPAYREPIKYLEVSLQSIRAQNVFKAYPDLFEVLLVNSEVPETAYKYVDRVISAPMGKLNARHEGILESRGEIIFSCDSDTHYPENWMNLMLKAFIDPEVVGASAPTDMNLSEYLLAIPKNIFYMGKMSGRASAFRKWAYFASGGFNLDINQLNIYEVLREEEFNFMGRLKRLGEVAYVNAPVYHFGEPSGRGLHDLKTY